MVAPCIACKSHEVENCPAALLDPILQSIPQHGARASIVQLLDLCIEKTRRGCHVMMVEMEDEIGHQ